MNAPRFVLTHSRRNVTPPPSIKVAAPDFPNSGSQGCGGGRAKPLPDAMSVVMVNGTEIYPEAIAHEMQNHPSDNAHDTWHDAARALVVRQLLLDEGRRLGIEADPERFDDNHAETEEEALIRTLLERTMAPASPSEDERRRVYEALESRFITPTLFEASHILIEPAGDDAAAWSTAEAEIADLIVLVGDDRAVFAEAAAARSTCPTANQGGSLGQIRRGELAESIQAALEQLGEGETSRTPVRSRYGWHAVRLERKIVGRALPFEIVEDRIADMLDARAWAINAAQYVADLAARANIEGIEITPPDAGFSSCADGGGC